MEDIFLSFNFFKQPKGSKMRSHYVKRNAIKQIYLARVTMLMQYYIPFTIGSTRMQGLINFKWFLINLLLFLHFIDFILIFIIMNLSWTVHIYIVNAFNLYLRFLRVDTLAVSLFAAAALGKSLFALSNHAFKSTPTYIGCVLMLNFNISHR